MKQFFQVVWIILTLPIRALLWGLIFAALLGGEFGLFGDGKGKDREKT